MSAIEKITRPAQAAGYKPNVYSGSWLSAVLDGRPRFTWLEAERMRYHPQVQFGLRVLRSPLWGATWKVKADKPEVSRWADRELKHVYQRLLPRLVRFYEFGVAAGEVTFAARTSKSTGRTRVHFGDFHEFHPRDCTPVVFERGKRAGQLAGLRVRNTSSASGVLLDRRHGFWLKGEAEFGAWYGRPRLANAYDPWFEKAARHGALDSRRLFYTKDAFRGPLMRHPLGYTDLGTPDAPVLMSNEDIARQIVEKFVNGGVLTLPNTKDDKGDYLWSWEDPKAFSDIAGLLDYPKQLDREILVGLGIPPELVEAAAVGSGYSGRAIPAQVFFSSMDEVIALLIEAIDRQIIRPLVRLNFGRTGYVIEPDSLAKQVASAMPGAMGTPGGAPGADPAGGGQPGPGGATPYVGPRGGQGTRDPRTGAIHYGRPKEHVRLSLRARKKKKARARARRACRVRMGWSAYQGPKGGRGWVSDSGEVRYQEEMPGDHEARPDVGPEALFDHPDFAHIPEHTSAAEPREFGQIKQDAHAQAQAAGIDPAELHKRAAETLNRHLDWIAQEVRYMAPAKALALHESNAKAHALLAESSRAKAAEQRAHAQQARRDEAERRALPDGHPWKASADAIGKYAGEHEGFAAAHERAADEASAKAAEHARAARQLRDGTAPGAQSINKRNVLAGAYSDAHKELIQEKGERDAAAAFAAAYFDHDKPLRRAAKYLKAVKDGADDGFKHLDLDTREAVAEDLSRLPPAKLAAHALYVANEFGGLDAPHAAGEHPQPWIAQKAIELAAARAGNPPKSERFDPANGADYYVATPDAVGEEAWAGVKAATKLLPTVRARFLDTEKAVLVRHGSALDKALTDADLDATSLQTSDDDGHQALFDSLKSDYQIAQSDVPASAKDYGGTSGSKGSGEYTPEKDWNPHAPDVYRRVDDTTYLVRFGDANPHRGGFGFVPVKGEGAAPPLSRLPEPYWEDFDSSPVNDQTEESERSAVREQKASDKGAKQKQEIKGSGGAGKYRRAAAKLARTHRRTGKLVQSDDALRDRVQAFDTEHDFSAGEGMPDPERDKPTRAALDELNAALGELGKHDHGHDYDPDAVSEDDFDASELAQQHDSREDHANKAKAAQEAFGEWSEGAAGTVSAAREAAVSESKRFRTDTETKLARVRKAALAVLNLPKKAVDDRTRAEAQEVVQKALKLTARAKRAVRMSLSGSRGRAGRRGDARELWAAATGPVLAPVAL